MYRQRHRDVTYFRGGLEALPEIADQLLLACRKDSRRHVWLGI
jgi:hypothetical protein